jgi:glycosyltransferase involved in cell wall biosynthesis
MKKRSVVVSIIIPTFNHPDALRRCLSSLADLAAGRPQFEVIVVDDGSTGNCAGIVADELAGLDWKFLRQENRGPATARNLGASHARGRYLAFVDDDCSLPENWLVLVDRSVNEKTMVGGQTVSLLTRSGFSTTNIPEEFWRPEDARFTLRLFLFFSEEG